MKRRWTVALAFLFLFCPSTYADCFPVTPNHVLSGDEIALNDRRILCLAAIKAVTPEARDFLTSIITGHIFSLHDAVIDLYGRVSAGAMIGDQKQSLEEMILQAGLAFVYPATGNVDNLMATEHAARQANKGYGADHPDIPSDDAEKLYGSYGIVSGLVTKAELVKNKVHLNLGDDWRTDFTGTIAAYDLRAFKNQDIDLLALQGKKLRVRG
jgi:endonuclease YncB( thermonuclease family)